MEKERARAERLNYQSPIHKSKKETDKDYDEALKLAIEKHHLVSICVGTHNAESSELATKLMEQNALPKNHKAVCFAQLLGMSNHISFNLAHAGYGVVKYVPLIHLNY